MGIHQVAIHQLLHRGKSAGAKGTVLRRGLTGIITAQGDLPTPDSHDIEPGGLNSAGARLRNRLTEGLNSDIAAAGTPDGGVTKLCRLSLGHTVERIGQLVARIGAYLLRAGGIVVIENLLGPEALDQVEVRGRAGGDWAESGSVRYRSAIDLISAALQTMLVLTSSTIEWHAFPWPYCLRPLRQSRRAGRSHHPAGPAMPAASAR